MLTASDGECLPGEFHCPGDDTCIPDRWLCDGRRDCTGGEDESTCSPCNEQEFRYGVTLHSRMTHGADKHSCASWLTWSSSSALTTDQSRSTKSRSFCVIHCVDLDSSQQSNCDDFFFHLKILINEQETEIFKKLNKLKKI